MISGKASDNQEHLVSYPARSLQVMPNPSLGLNDVNTRTKQLSDLKSGLYDIICYILLLDLLQIDILFRCIQTRNIV